MTTGAPCVSPCCCAMGRQPRPSCSFSVARPSTASVAVGCCYSSPPHHSSSSTPVAGLPSSVLFWCSTSQLKVSKLLLLLVCICDVQIVVHLSASIYCSCSMMFSFCDVQIQVDVVLPCSWSLVGVAVGMLNSFLLVSMFMAECTMLFSC